MRKKIAIAAGGDSGEYEVSIKSGAVVEKYLNRDLYDPYLVIFHGDEWVYHSIDGQKHPVDKNDFSLMTSGEKITFDAVFIAIHGTPGEDGKLQGYLDMLGIPYTGSGHVTSALTFNKYFCSRVVASMGVTIAPSMLIRRGEQIDQGAVSRTLPLPCFVKPNKGGSSVGMTKVWAVGELLPAVEKAFLEDEEVLIETFIPGTEITCGVMTIGGKVKSLPLTEIVSKNEFFDYEAKYTDGMADEITPARVPAVIETKCRALSEKLYAGLGCRGFVRFDYIFNDQGMYFLEVNTVPGLSPNSILPQQAQAEGISLQELFTAALRQVI